jgi:hemolysin III
MDHSVIYILIAGTITPICVLAMDGWVRWILLSAVWAGALFGAGLTATRGHRHPRLSFALYLILGWAAIGTFPAFADQPGRLALVITAGLLYTVGAILFSMHRPLPHGRVFGYHEVWHLLGVVAGTLLFIVNFGVISQ